MVAIKIPSMLLAALCAIISARGNTAVLAEERVDALYHNYNGGGVVIDGPSILIRKNVGDSISVSANYYVDTISSASIDVVTQASPYNEERTQVSLGADYLYDKSIMSIAYSTSTENDFDAETTSFNISQEIFGGLTTVSLGFTVGNNIITRSTDNIFKADSSTKDYRISLSQVLTKDMLLGLTYEVITDQGFLNNSYRQVRYSDGLGGTAFQDEAYPETRTSNAASVNLRYYLPYRASVYGGYRFFTDSWNINANTFEFGYVHPLQEKWLFEVNFRAYSQSRASFFSSLFPNIDAQNFLASDKELSTFSSNSIGAGVTYKFTDSSLNFYIDHFTYNYDDFLNTTVTTATPGTEPAYSYSANVIRFYYSLWF